MATTRLSILRFEQPGQLIVLPIVCGSAVLFQDHKVFPGGSRPLSDWLPVSAATATIAVVRAIAISLATQMATTRLSILRFEQPGQLIVLPIVCGSAVLFQDHKVFPGGSRPLSDWLPVSAATATIAVVRAIAIVDSTIQDYNQKRNDRPRHAGIHNNFSSSEKRQYESEGISDTYEKDHGEDDDLEEGEMVGDWENIPQAPPRMESKEKIEVNEVNEVNEEEAHTNDNIQSKWDIGNPTDQEEGGDSSDNRSVPHEEENKGEDENSINSPVDLGEERQNETTIVGAGNHGCEDTQNNCWANQESNGKDEDSGSQNGPEEEGLLPTHHKPDDNPSNSQEGDNSEQGSPGEVRSGINEGDNSSINSIDLNCCPTERQMNSGENEDRGTNGKIQKKGVYATLNPISMKLKDRIHTKNANSSKKAKKRNGKSGKSASQTSQNISVNSISCEVLKTANIGKEVGFQLDGFEEKLRAEIEGEGAANPKK
ncbi:hypothetical protein L1887_02387 [Cichorium endivia]|nr:hypothetical protein L1887_02387 [Cichorium endivia]